MAHHGISSIDIVAPRSPLYQGPFGRIFSELTPWSMDKGAVEKYLQDNGLPAGGTIHDVFAHIASKMIERPNDSPSQIAQEETANKAADNTLSSQLPAGYTYFGQFIDHDITFDPASSLMRQNDPNGLLNHRTPRLDLDSVYGSGPEASPHLYQAQDPAKFLVGKVAGSKFLDLPRNSEGTALLGDMRNDENSVVSQLHLAFLLAHNTLVDRARKHFPNENAFELARNTLRWLYQYIVWNDFIKRISKKDVFENALVKDKEAKNRIVWKPNLKSVFHWKNNPYMPVEFAVAAYRFGHSMVRNSYQTNNHRGFGNFIPIFDNSPTAPANVDDMRGFRPIIAKNVIQWDWFLPMKSSGGPFPQRAKKIDTKMANALAALHAGPAGSPLNILALRNLQRGLSFDLPSGSDVAKKLGFEPMKNVKTHEDMLWFYILKEAETQTGGETLGDVGSTIVCAVFAGLLTGDPFSYFSMNPAWTPNKEPKLLLKEDKQDTETSSKDWELSAIIRLAALPVDGTAIANLAQ